MNRCLKKLLRAFLNPIGTPVPSAAYYSCPTFYNVPLQFILLLLLYFSIASSVPRNKQHLYKTPMFSKQIGGHNCYFQREDQTTKYSPGLKELLFSNRIYKNKEIASLFTLFTEHSPDSDNSNFVFNKLYKILISLETGQITYYDDLFCELFLHRYRTRVKKNVMCLTNIHKVRHFKRKITFSKSINFFLDQGETIQTDI